MANGVTGKGEGFTSLDPATGEPVWEGAAASPADVDDAMSAARAAFPSWCETPLDQRDCDPLSAIAILSKAMPKCSRG